MPLTEVGGWMRIEMDGDPALLHVQTNTGSTKYKITKQAIYSIFALRQAYRLYIKATPVVRPQLGYMVKHAKER